MLKVIKNNTEHEAALERIYDLMQQDLNQASNLTDELELLVVLVELYEKENYPFPSPNPIEAIRFRMEQMGISETELPKILGSRSKKTDILGGKSKLTLNMVRNLHQRLHIPLQSLIF